MSDFNPDDWDTGFCCDQKLHEEETDKDDGEKDTKIRRIDDADLPGRQTVEKEAVKAMSEKTGLPEDFLNNNT